MIWEYLLRNISAAICPLNHQECASVNILEKKMRDLLVIFIAFVL